MLSEWTRNRNLSDHSLERHLRQCYPSYQHLLSYFQTVPIILISMILCEMVYVLGDHKFEKTILIV